MAAPALELAKNLDNSALDVTHLKSPAATVLSVSAPNKSPETFVATNADFSKLTSPSIDAPKSLIPVEASIELLKSADVAERKLGLKNLLQADKEAGGSAVTDTVKSIIVNSKEDYNTRLAAVKVYLARTTPDATLSLLKELMVRGGVDRCVGINMLGKVHTPEAIETIKNVLKSANVPNEIRLAIYAAIDVGDNGQLQQEVTAHLASQRPDVVAAAAKYVSALNKQLTARANGK